MPGEVVSSLLLEVSKRSWIAISQGRPGGFCPGGCGFPPNPERLLFSALGPWVTKGGKACSFLLTGGWLAVGRQAGPRMRGGRGGTGQHRASSLDSRSLRVVLRPDGLELIQVMRAQDGPVPCQVVKVVHDDGHKEVDDLWEESRGVPAREGRWHGDGLGVSRGPGGVQGTWVCPRGLGVSGGPGCVHGALRCLGGLGVFTGPGCPRGLGVSTGPGCPRGLGVHRAWVHSFSRGPGCARGLGPQLLQGAWVCTGPGCAWGLGPQLLQGACLPALWQLRPTREQPVSLLGSRRCPLPGLQGLML